MGSDLHRPGSRQGQQVRRRDGRGPQGDAPHRLVEAASSGSLDRAAAALPPKAQQTAVDAAREGVLAGLNDVLTIGALLSFAGAALALWLVREREIERLPFGVDGQLASLGK